MGGDPCRGGRPRGAAWWRAQEVTFRERAERLCGLWALWGCFVGKEGGGAHLGVAFWDDTGRLLFEVGLEQWMS